MRLGFVLLAAAVLIWSGWTIAIETKRPGLRNIAFRLEHGDPVVEIDLLSDSYRDGAQTLAAPCRDSLVREATTLSLGRVARGVETATDAERKALFEEAARALERYLACTPTNGDIWFHYARVMDRLEDPRTGAALVMSARTFPYEQRTLLNRIRTYSRLTSGAPAADSEVGAARKRDLDVAIRNLDMSTISEAVGQ